MKTGHARPATLLAALLLLLWKLVSFRNTLETNERRQMFWVEQRGQEKGGVQAAAPGVPCRRRPLSGISLDKRLANKEPSETHFRSLSFRGGCGDQERPPLPHQTPAEPRARASHPPRMRLPERRHPTAGRPPCPLAGRRAQRRPAPTPGRGGRLRTEPGRTEPQRPRPRREAPPGRPRAGRAGPGSPDRPYSPK